LPGYLAASCYLSLEPCAVGRQHTYRHTGLWVRYLDGDDCMRCTNERAVAQLEGRA
jgi:hypothetical protein